MCGRYALAGDWNDFTSEFGLEEVPGLTPRYNIAPSAGPGYEAPIITEQGLVMARFWYIPRWWKQPLKKLPTAFNVRSETATEKPFFRGGRRCLVPTSGWREFPGPSAKKRAFQLYRPRVDGQPDEAPRSPPDAAFFAFAGLCTEWTHPDTGEVVTSFAIVTAPPNDLVKQVHHRMPVLVSPDHYERFLDPSVPFNSVAEEATRFSHGAPLQMYETTTFGNGTRVEGPACIEPVRKQASLF